MCGQSRTSYAAVPPDVRPVSDLPSRGGLRESGLRPRAGEARQSRERRPVERHSLSTHRAAEPLTGDTHEPFDTAATNKECHRLDLSNGSRANQSNFFFALCHLIYGQSRTSYAAVPPDARPVSGLPSRGGLRESGLRPRAGVTRNRRERRPVERPSLSTHQAAEPLTGNIHRGGPSPPSPPPLSNCSAKTKSSARVW
jgi:hypothetical protein